MRDIDSIREIGLHSRERVRTVADQLRNLCLGQFQLVADLSPNSIRGDRSVRGVTARTMINSGDFSGGIDKTQDEFGAVLI